MKKLSILLFTLITVISAQAQTLATLECANKDYVNVYHWAEISSEGEQMQIGNLSVEFVAEQARMTHETSITNHITKSPTRTSAEGQVIKGKLYENGTVIGTARFSHVGTSMAGTADIGNDTYKFRPDKDGSYVWELEAPFVCGTDDTHHNCDVEHPEHNHGAKELHQNDGEFLSVPSLRSPTDCTTESIQDVAFITDDLMTEYGNDLNAILAQIAISDSWATDVMEDSGFPDIAFFQESVHVVDFAESGTTWGNIQVFNDSLYATPPGIMATIMQNATSSVTVLYSLGGGAYSGVATISVAPMPSGYYYKAVLGNNNGIGNYVKMHEYGHALWGGEHEDQTPNPVLYRRAYLGTDATWGNYVTVMGQGNFGGGVRVYRFSDDDPTAGWYSETFDHTFSPVGNADRDMCRRINEEWNRPGIVQVVTIPAPTVTTHPSDVTVCEGDAFTLNAAGNNVDSYQWYKNGTAISGATSASYTVSSAIAGDAGSYYCELSNSCYFVNTNSATVTVNLQVVVTTHPQDVTVVEGNPFTVTAAGNNVTGYQWYFGGSPITGATSATYSVSSASAADAGDYYCELSNGCGSVNTNTATVTVNEPGSLVLAPTSFDAPASAGSTTVALTSNVNWSVSSVASWYSVSPMSGSGDATLTITYNENTSTTSRTDDFTVSGEGESATFTLNQDGATPNLNIDPNSVTVSANAGNTNFGITSNESWSIETSDAAVTATPSSGSGNETINVSYPAINTMAGETYTVTVTSNSNIVEVFTINQDGVNAFIVLTPNNANVPAAEGSLTFAVDCPSDLSWNLIDLATWLTASPLSGTGPETIGLNYEANTTSESRSDDFNVSGSGATDVFSINQVGAGSPTANFLANPIWGTETLTSQFSDESSAGTNPIISWSWDFGDGGTSSNQNPEHTFSSPGSYTVSLTVSDGDLSDTETKVDYIQVYEVLTVNAGDDQALEMGQTSQLEGSYSGGSGNIAINWIGLGNTIPISNPGILNPVAGPFETVDEYYFELSVEDLITGEIQTDEMMVDVLLGLEEDLSSKIAVYPNPTSGKLWIETEEPIESIKINDALGSEINQLKPTEKTTVINLSYFPNGVYLVQVLTKDGLRTFKVVKK